MYYSKEMSSNHLLFRGLKAYLSKWKARGFDNDVKRLVSLLEAGSIAQAEQMVRKLKNENYDYSLSSWYCYCFLTPGYGLLSVSLHCLLSVSLHCKVVGSNFFGYLFVLCLVLLNFRGHYR